MTAPTLGLAQAAKATGVSQSTLRRRRTEMLELGATQSDKGWEIPIPVLIQMGLMDRTTPADQVEAVSEPAIQEVEASMVAQLEARLAAANERADRAEMLAAERDRTIRTQETAMRMIEAMQPKAADQPAPRRRWWQLG